MTHELLISKGSKPRRGAVIECGYCRSEFYVRPCHVGTKKYCSRRCHTLGQIVKPEGVELITSTGDVKRCVLCGSSENGFYKGKKTYSGSFPKCIKCVNDSNREWKRAHPERTAEIARKHRQKFKDRVLATRYAWQRANPEKVKAYARRNFERHREAFKRRSNEWMKAHPEKAQEIYRKQQAKPETKLRHRLRQAARVRQLKKTDDGTITAEAITRMIAQQKGLCNICKKDISGKYEVDHIFPVVKGGRHTISNIQLLCRPCNIKKGSKLPT